MSTVSSAAGENNPISRQESHTSPIKSLITARSVSRSPPLSAKGKKSSPERQMSKISHKSESPEKLKKVGTTLMEAEKMETGKVCQFLLGPRTKRHKIQIVHR